MGSCCDESRDTNRSPDLTLAPVVHHVHVQLQLNFYDLGCNQYCNISVTTLLQLLHAIKLHSGWCMMSLT